MKLGTETGSVTNHLMSRMTLGQPEPKVGMGATVLAWTDRYAATIIDVKSIRGKVYITVQTDEATLTSGNILSEDQEYTYRRNEYGYIHHFLMRNNKWQEMEFNANSGRWRMKSGYGLQIGYRQEYSDPSF